MQDNNNNKVLLTASMVMYGNVEETHKSILSVCSKVESAGFVLYLIDNASPQNALSKLKNLGLPANVSCIALKENRGYGSGHNSVLNIVNSQYHAVLNPDIEFFDDILSKMAFWMEKNPDVAICAPALIFPDGTPQPLPKKRPSIMPLIARQTGFKFLEKYNNSYLMADKDLSVPTDVGFCSGSLFLIKTEVFKKIGGFDEKYFMYVEDADITQKALQVGRAVFLPQFTACHAWHREARKNPKKFFWQMKSMFRYFCKWGFKFK